MLDDISPAAERALERAKKASTNGELQSALLLTALIEDDEGRAATLLLEAGGDLGKVRAILTTLDAGTITLPNVLMGASEIAGERAETTITGEYLLLGLLHAVPTLHDPLHQGGVQLAHVLRRKEIPIIAMSEKISLDDPTDHLSAARIVDVNANRAREALRVLDDYARFVLNDAYLTEQLKTLRHDLVSVLHRVPAEILAPARDTTGDVGTTIATHAEMLRGSTADVAKVNLKRLQEALRSLEEYGKLLSTELAVGVEALRYRAYTLERTMLIELDALTRLANANLYVLLTGSQCTAALDWTIREAAAGGADIFQLREKTLDDQALLERAKNVRRWTRETGTLFIMNDRPDLARLAEADGVHLGQDDLAVAEARKILGPKALIGVSTHSLADVEKALRDGANYIGVGPTFASSTKDFQELAGLAYVRTAMARTALPAFAIGGITSDNVGEVVAAGATRIAVSAAIATADDPQRAAALLKAQLPRPHSPPG